jgi:hypothetical protein
LTDQKPGGWADNPDPVPLVSAMPIQHMPVAPPVPPATPMVKGVAFPSGDEEAHAEAGAERGTWEPV